jgi:hypothetical protein
MNLQELDNYILDDAINFHTDLNPQIWNYEEKMRPEVHKALLDIADDFREFLGIGYLALVDITVSGSNAAYSYTPHSDIDLHLVVDFKKLSNDEVYKELFNAKKYQYNDQHNIRIRSYDVELYVQDVNQRHESLGEYSLMKDDWNKIPTQKRANIDDNATHLKYNKLHDLIVLALAGDNLEHTEAAIDILKRYRQAGLAEKGEFSPENLAFKVLRKKGFVQKLYDKRDALEDAVLSI